jgi:MFS family permease
LKNTFRSLANTNYRIWAAGALVSNIGTWMQRTAQDWIVLTQLSHNNATAVGIVTAFQFAPQILLLPLTGYAADHFDRRKLLIATQACMGLLALGLGVLLVTHLVVLWHVYVFALLLGCVAAFDAPARQTFVANLVDEPDIPNAVALNSTSFHVARTIGPAAAGILITSIGSGWVFLLNTATFAGVLVSLALLRPGKLHAGAAAHRKSGSFTEGFRYIWARSDLKTILFMLFLVGTFGIHFPIFISTMAVKIFHSGAGRYGLLSSMMAVGSVTGALLAARRGKSHVALLVAGTSIFGAGFTLAALMPSYWSFGATLVLIGVAAQTFTTTAFGTVQLTTDAAMRGRVVAILLAVALGGTPIGAPFVGWVADTFGPRYALCVGAAAGFAASLVGLAYLARHHHLRIRLRAGRLRVSMAPAE